MAKRQHAIVKVASLVFARPPQIALFRVAGENNQPAITISDGK